MSEKPNTTIYLDVDGVINSLSKKPPRSMTGWGGEWSREPVTTLDGSTWPIHWSHELVDHINALAARDDVTIKWLTTWENSAAKNLSPVLGINGEDWEVLERRSEPVLGWGMSRSDWWKFPLIQDDVARNNIEKFIWIDDDLAYYPPAINWVRGKEETGNALAISPSVYLGVTKEDIDGIIEFINA